MNTLTFRILSPIILAIAIVVVAKVLVLPYLLRTLLATRNATTVEQRTEVRYQRLHTGVWMFAWFKLRLDAMFRELPEFLQDISEPKAALDLGCGFGVAGAWMLERFAELRIYGIDPNPKRVAAAARVFGNRGVALLGGAPDFELAGLPDKFDFVLALDMSHYLTDEQFSLTLQRIRGRLKAGGRLILRAPMLPMGSGSLRWKLARLDDRIRRLFTCYRTVEQIQKIIERAGFEIRWSKMSGASPELYWFVAIGEQF